MTPDPHRPPATILDRIVATKRAEVDAARRAVPECELEELVSNSNLRPALDYRFAREAGFRAGEFDVGYRLVRTAWGYGYATEVTRALARTTMPSLATPSMVVRPLAGSGQSMTLGLTEVFTAS